MSSEWETALDEVVKRRSRWLVVRVAAWSFMIGAFAGAALVAYGVSQ